MNSPGEMDMFIWTARLTRKKAAAAVILAGALLCALILFLGRSLEEEVPPADLITNEARIAYLGDWGWFTLFVLICLSISVIYLLANRHVVDTMNRFLKLHALGRIFQRGGQV